MIGYLSKMQENTTLSVHHIIVNWLEDRSNQWRVIELNKNRKLTPPPVNNDFSDAIIVVQSGKLLKYFTEVIMNEQV